MDLCTREDAAATRGCRGDEGVMTTTQRSVMIFGAFVTLALMLNALTMIYAPALIPPRLALFADNPRRWEAVIRRFEKEDARLTPPAGSIVFIGSSMIRRWNLSTSFPDLTREVLNRGFGGSYLSESVYYADRLIVPHAPNTVVLYGGDADIAAGVSAQTVAQEFVQFEQRVHRLLPDTRIIFISIKPSPGRQRFRIRVDAANEAVRAWCASHPQLIYLDVEPLMLRPDGEPREELFMPDGVQLNAQGYEVVASALRPLLAQAR
jgi:lysophospholipase L1-like esterase